MREMHGTLLCCQISVIKTDQEVVEYSHDRRLDVGIHLGNRLSAAQRYESQCDQRDGSERCEHWVHLP